jgi:peptide/nickel transport system permease protein
VVAIAALGPYVAPYAPDEFVGQPYATPSDAARLGTDGLGRDVLSRVLWGGRSVLILSSLATVLAVLGGLIIGLAAAYSRGVLDDILMRSVDVILAFPQMVLALLLVSIIGPQLWLIVLAVGLAGLPTVARVVRGAAVEVTEREFVLISEGMGESRVRILVNDIFPNITSPLAVTATLRLTFNIAIIAGLSFLGLGLQPPAADWGLMIAENRAGLELNPWCVVVPMFAIGLLTIGMGLLGDGFARASGGIESRAASS